MSRPLSFNSPSISFADFSPSFFQTRHLLHRFPRDRSSHSSADRSDGSSEASDVGKVHPRDFLRSSRQEERLHFASKRAGESFLLLPFDRLETRSDVSLSPQLVGTALLILVKSSLAQAVRKVEGSSKKVSPRDLTLLSALADALPLSSHRLVFEECPETREELPSEWSSTTLRFVSLPL